MPSETEKSTSAPSGAFSIAQDDERHQDKSDGIALPSHVAGSGSLDRLVDTARDYARAAASDNTLKAYAKDWAHFTRWCRMKGAEPLPPSPEMIGLYLADLASGAGPSPARSVSTIDRRLSGLAWNYAQRGFALDRKNRHIATVLAGIKRKHARPPVQKEAILAEDILGMVATLPYDLRGLRDRAILLIGYAGGLRRSEIVSLDVHKDDTPNSGGWIEVLDDVPYSPSMPRLAGGRLRLAAGPRIKPAPCMRLSNGCISPRSTSAQSSSAPHAMANAPQKPG